MANLFPDAPVDPVESADELAVGAVLEPAFGRSWQFDFRLGEFVLTPTGKVSAADGTDAWAEWCRKALLTDRYRHLAYSRRYGQEFEGLIGVGLSRSATESEIRRITTETLMADPRTAGVDDFRFEWEADRCLFSCTITNVRDQARTITGSVVNP